MADHDHGVRIARDVLLEPERAFEIEIVGRLVEQQEIGLGEQRRRERDAHAPAAGEFGAGALLLGMREAEAGEDFGGARGRRMRADVGEPRLDFGDADADRCAVSASARSCVALAVGVEHDLDQALGPSGASCASRPMRARAGSATSPCSSAQLAGDDAEQRGLAGAVAADEARRARRPECAPWRASSSSCGRRSAGDVVDHEHARRYGATLASERGWAERCKRRHMLRMLSA